MNATYNQASALLNMVVHQLNKDRTGPYLALQTRLYGRKIAIMRDEVTIRNVCNKFTFDEASSVISSLKLGQVDEATSIIKGKA